MSLSVSPRRKNVHGALANVHEWSPSLLSPSFVAATVSQVSVYSQAATSLSVSPRRKNVHGALANVHEWSLSLLSPSFVEQVTGS